MNEKIKEDIIQDNFQDVINADKTKRPIYKGCSTPEGVGCFCTGECREVVGYIDIEDIKKYIKFIGDNNEDN